MKFNLRTSFSRSLRKKTIAFCLAVGAIALMTAPESIGQIPNRKIARQNPSITEAVRLLQNDQFDEAEKFIRDVLTASPKNVEAKTLLGVILDQKGDAAAAEKEYLDILQINPKTVPALANLGILLAKTNRQDEAVKMLKRVLTLQPNHEQAAYNLAVIYSSQNDFQKALPLLEKLVGITPANRTPKTKDILLVLALAKTYAATKNTQKLNGLIAFINAENKDVRAWFTLGLMLAQANQYETAAGLFEKVNAERPNTFDVLYNLGIAYYNTDKFDAARTIFLQAQSLEQNSPEIYYRLGLVASAEKDSDAAVSYWLKALELKENYAEVNFLIGEELLKNKKLSGSVPFYERASAQEPENSLYQIRLGIAYFRVQRYNQASAIFKVLVEKYPKNFNLNYLKGYTARAEGLYDEALVAFENALLISPNNAEVLSNLGFIANERGDVVKAEKILREVLFFDGKNFSARYDLGRLLIKQKKYAEAVPILETGADLNKNDPGIRYQLFIAYSRLKQKEKANATLAEFNRLEKLSRKPNSPATSTDQTPDLPASVRNLKP